jgi:hypothetical protein
MDDSASVPFCKRPLRALYALTNSNCSAPLSVSAALNLKPSGFVVLGLRRITVPRQYNALHTHSGPYRLWSVLPAHDFFARPMAVSEGAIMQHPIYRLRRIPLPRTPVNERIRKGRGCYTPALARKF